MKISVRFPRSIPPSEITLSGQDNYESWAPKISSWMLIVPGKLHELIRADAATPTPPAPGSNHAIMQRYERVLNVWTARDEACRGAILYTCSPFAKSLVENLGTAKEVWEKLKSSFQTSNPRSKMLKRTRSETLSSEENDGEPSAKKLRPELRPCRNWILSTYMWSGTEYHLGRDKNVFTEYEPFDGYVENCDSDGNVIGRAKVVGKGNVWLRVRRRDPGANSSKSENRRRIFDLCLSNTLHVPGLSYNVVSYHALEKESKKYSLHGPSVVTLEREGSQVAQFQKIDNSPWHRLDLCKMDSSGTELALEGNMSLQGPLWRYCDLVNVDSDSDSNIDSDSESDSDTLQQREETERARSNKGSANVVGKGTSTEFSAEVMNGKGQVNGTTTHPPIRQANGNRVAEQTSTAIQPPVTEAPVPAVSMQPSAQEKSGDSPAEQTSTHRPENRTQQPAQQPSDEPPTEQTGSQSAGEHVGDTSTSRRFFRAFYGEPGRASGLDAQKHLYHPDLDEIRNSGSDEDEDEDEDEEESEKDPGNHNHKQDEDDEDSTDSSDSDDDGKRGGRVMETIKKPAGVAVLYTPF